MEIRTGTPIKIITKVAILPPSFFLCVVVVVILCVSSLLRSVCTQKKKKSALKCEENRKRIANEVRYTKWMKKGCFFFLPRRIKNNNYNNTMRTLVTTFHLLLLFPPFFSCSYYCNRSLTEALNRPTDDLLQKQLKKNAIIKREEKENWRKSWRRVDKILQKKKAQVLPLKHSWLDKHGASLYVCVCRCCCCPRCQNTQRM